MTSARAFTLLEILIAVTVVAIVALMVVPQLGATDAGRLKAAAELLIAELEFARIESLTRGDDACVFVLADDMAGYSLEYQSAPGVPITHPAARLPFVTRFGTGRAAPALGVTVSAYSLGGDKRLRFQRYGQLDQVAGATLTLSRGGRTLTVTVDYLTGQASAGDIQ